MTRKAIRLPKRLDTRRAVMVLHRRVEKLERAVFGTKRIGFDVTEARGDVIEQGDDDETEIPEET
jgi:hypothetical protein